MIKEINGDLIALALQGKFDAIAHGCNCFCRMKRGIAPQMAATFGCDRFPLEDVSKVGGINKLGQIDPVYYTERITKPLWVVNLYTQYHWERPGSNGKIPLEYDALCICLIKLNFVFNGKHVGLPKIGCGLAGGDWRTVKQIIINTMKDCDVTIANF